MRETPYALTSMSAWKTSKPIPTWISDIFNGRLISNRATSPGDWDKHFVQWTGIQSASVRPSFSAKILIQSELLADPSSAIWIVSIFSLEFCSSEKSNQCQIHQNHHHHLLLPHLNLLLSQSNGHHTSATSLINCDDRANYICMSRTLLMHDALIALHDFLHNIDCLFSCSFIAVYSAQWGEC